MMTTLKRIFALLLSLVLCLSLAACSGNADPTPSADPSASSEASGSPDASASPEASAAIEADLTQSILSFSSGLDSNDMAMTVNGVEVPNQMFLFWLAYDCSTLDSYYASSYGINVDYSNAQMAAYVLGDAQAAAIYYAILEQLCGEYNADLTPKQTASIQQELDSYVEAHGQEGLDFLLQQSGLDEEHFREMLSHSYQFNNLADAAIGTPSAADLEQYVADAGIFSVKHILLKTTTSDIQDSDGNVTQTAEEYNAQRKALAEDLLAQLRSSDDMETLFDALMNEHSEDGRDDSGNLSAPDGYTFDADSSLVSGFREASLAVEVGCLTDLVETAYGYHIILRLPVDASEYEADYMSDTTDALISAATQEADISISDALSTIDVADFYTRYTAYLAALQDAAAAG